MQQWQCAQHEFFQHPRTHTAITSVIVVCILRLVFWTDIGVDAITNSYRIVLKVDNYYADAGTNLTQSVKIMTQGSTTATAAYSDWIGIGTMQRGIDYHKNIEMAVELNDTVDTEWSMTAVAIDSGFRLATDEATAAERVHFFAIGGCVSTRASFERSHPCYDIETQTIISPCTAHSTSMLGQPLLSYNPMHSIGPASGMACGFMAANRTLTCVGGSLTNDFSLQPFAYDAATATTSTTTTLVRDYSQIAFSPTPATIDFLGQSVVQALDDRLYAFHAYTYDDNQYKSLIIYDLKTQEFVNRATYSEWASYTSLLTCATYDPLSNVIYVTQGTTNMLEKYIIDSDAWAVLAAPPETRDGPGCAMNAASTKLYRFAGWDHDSAKSSQDIAEYSVAGNTWTMLSATLANAGHPTCVLLPFALHSSHRDSSGLILCIIASQIELFDPDTLTVASDTYVAQPGLNWSTYLMIDMEYKCVVGIGGGQPQYICQCSERTTIDLDTCSFRSSPIDFPSPACAAAAAANATRRRLVHDSDEHELRKGDL